MYRTSAYPHLLRKFSDGDTTVLHDWSPQLVNELVISACWGPTRTRVALHRRAANFESLICVMPMAASPKTRGIFRMVSTWLSPSFWQHLMQYRCSIHSVILVENNKATRAAYALPHTRWLHANDAVCWWEKIHIRAWWYPLPQHTSRASLVSSEKKKSRHILFE
jgi:hypothetical protein